MIEDFNDLLSIIMLIVAIVGGIAMFVVLNRTMRKEEDIDEYYRDLL